MPKKKNRKKGGAPSRESILVAPETLPDHMSEMKISPVNEPCEETHPVKMPTGFNMDDFLFSKLYKSVNVEGRRVLNIVLRILFRHKVGRDGLAYSLDQLLTHTNLSKTQRNTIISKSDERFLPQEFLTIEFDVTLGIRILQKVFYEEYKKLSSLCKIQIGTFRELRNTLCHNYPLVSHEYEIFDEKLNTTLLKKNKDFFLLRKEIKSLEKEIVSDEIKKSIDVKRKEIYVIYKIEKLRITLNDILEDIGAKFEEDLTSLKRQIDRNLTDITSAKVKQYDQNYYDEEVERFKKDPLHQLISSAREELKQQYKKLRVANPCPWMLNDQAEQSSVVNFYIDKIYTPLRIIEGPKKEISTEELLVTSKNFGKKTSVPPALLITGLAGAGKTSLCLNLLHHWAEGTGEIKGLNDYNLVIFVEMRAVRSSTFEQYLKTQRMKKSCANISSDDIVQQLDDLKLLFIIDGYDEAKKSSKKMVEDIFAKFPEQHILVTTRGEFCDDIKRFASRHHVEYLNVEICGFDSSRIEEFTEKVFAVIKRSSKTHCQASSSKDSAEFLLYVRKRETVLAKLLELPLTLALMIYLWKDCPDILNRVTTCTSLYYELFSLYQKKLKDRLEVGDPCQKSVENLLVFIGRKAWDLLTDEETVVSKEVEQQIEEQCRKEGIPKEELMSAFLVYESADTSDYKYGYSFLHKTQMEYLSAYFLAEETEERGLDHALESVSGSGMNQVILFLVGHFARKRIIEEKFDEIFKFLDISDIKQDDFNFWWDVFTESLNNSKFLWEICYSRGLNVIQWKLSMNNVVSGLELLIVAPVYVKELIIDIENGTDPYDIKDLLTIMRTLKGKLRYRYNKENPILTELLFRRHLEFKCPKPSDEFITTLYPWGHLKHFIGSIGEQPQNHEVLNYCYKVKNLRIRIDTCRALVCLANSMQRIGRSVRNLRVMLGVEPEKCDPSSFVCLINNNFKGNLELTLPNMNDENKKWVVQTVKKISGENGCSRLVLEKSILSFTVVLYIMMGLRDVVLDKLTVETVYELTEEEERQLEKQKKITHMEANWIVP